MHLHFLASNGNALYPRLVSIFNRLYKFSRKCSNVPRGILLIKYRKGMLVDEQIFIRFFNILNRKKNQYYKYIFMIF